MNPDAGIDIIARNNQPRPAVVVALHGDEPAAQNPEALDDRALARRVATDRESFGVVFDHYYEPVLNFLHRRTRDREVAEDLAAQVFCTAFDHLAASERDMPHLRAWLYRAALNAWLNHERSGRALVARVVDMGRRLMQRTQPSPALALGTTQQLDLVRGELARLKPIHREVLMLRFDDELDDDDIAVVLGIARATVRSRVARGLAALRQRVARIDGNLLGEVDK